MAVLRPGVGDLRSLGQFTQAFRWNIMFEKFPALVPGYTSQDINFRAESVDIPGITGSSVDIQVRGSKVKQPGLFEYSGTIALTMIETMNNKVANFAYDWRAVLWDRTHGSRGLQHYKEMVEATILINRLDVMDELLWGYRLHGCVMENVEMGSLDASAAEPLKPAFTIAYDYFEELKHNPSPQ